VFKASATIAAQNPSGPGFLTAGERMDFTDSHLSSGLPLRPAIAYSSGLYSQCMLIPSLDFSVCASSTDKFPSGSCFFFRVFV
jgi:hypothetical protein